MTERSSQFPFLLAQSAALVLTKVENGQPSSPWCQQHGVRPKQPQQSQLFRDAVVMKANTWLN